MTPILARNRWKRLKATIEAYEQELSGRKTLSGGTYKSAAPVIQPVLTRASRALDEGDIELGWQCFHCAKRLELLVLEQSEWEAAAAGIRNEASKLRDWRKQAIDELLDAQIFKTSGDKPDRHADGAQPTGGAQPPDIAPPPCPPQAPNIPVPSGPDKPPRSDQVHGKDDKVGDGRSGRLFRAALLRDEHYDNAAYKDTLLRSNSLSLAVILAGTLAALLWMGSAGYLPSTIPAPDRANLTPESDSFATLLAVAVVGLLGATFSAIISATKPSGPVRVPELVSSLRVTLLRLLIGPASAIVIYFVTRSTLYSFVFTFARPEDYALLTIAFVAGFSERLVLRAVETIAGKDTNSPSVPAG
jgi:hypothetical protein